MTGDILLCEDFEPHLGTDFVLVDAGIPPIVLTLEEAGPIPGVGSNPASRAPFSLLFKASDSRVLPQASYGLRHEAMGERQIFLIPRGKDASGVLYEAVFN